MMQRFLSHFGGAIAFAITMSAMAFTPQKPVELVVHTGPGGGNDVLGRAIAAMAEKENLLPVRLVVVNKPGGNGAVAANYLVDKKANPHVVGLITSAWLIGPMTTAEAQVTVTDLTPIAQLVLEPAVIVVRADSPYRTLKDFID